MGKFPAGIVNRQKKFLGPTGLKVSEGSSLPLGPGAVNIGARLGGRFSSWFSELPDSQKEFVKLCSY